MKYHNNKSNDVLRLKGIFLFATVILSALISVMVSLVIDRVVLPAPHLVTVDIPGLMMAYAKVEAKRTDSLAQQRADVHQFSQQLERVLKDIAQREHVIIIPQKAVIAGGKDITQEVTTRLMAPSAEGYFSSPETSDGLR